MYPSNFHRQRSNSMSSFSGKFSPETKQLVQGFMKETGLTAIQQRQFQNLLRTNEPQKTNPHMAKRRIYVKRRNISRSLGYIPPGDSVSRQNYLHQKLMRLSLGSLRPTRRRLDQIKASGAYEPARPEPSMAQRCVVKNKEKEIEKLQHIMEHGKEKPSKAEVLRHKMEKLSKAAEQVRTPEMEKAERFNELIDEIADRVQFLNEMQEAGKDKEYRNTIEFQIKGHISELQRDYCRADVFEVVRQFGLEHFLSKQEVPDVAEDVPK